MSPGPREKGRSALTCLACSAEKAPLLIKASFVGWNPNPPASQASTPPFPGKEGESPAALPWPSVGRPLPSSRSWKAGELLLLRATPEMGSPEGQGLFPPIHLSLLPKEEALDGEPSTGLAGQGT